MNISLQNTDDLNAVITVNIKKEDIAENVEKTMRDYKRKAQVPGFRPGMVPMGLIKKMYGDAIMAEELNKKISDSLNEFLSNESINVLGDPMPNEQQEPIDFNATDDYNFLFDIGLTPQFEVKLTKRDKVNYYKIKVDDEMIDKQIAQHRQRHGSFVEASVPGEKSMFRGLMIEADDEMNPKENGVVKEDASFYLGSVKDDDIKAQLLQMEIGTNLAFDIKKAFPNESELSSMLEIDKKQVETMSSNFRFTLEMIRDFADAEMNADFFQRVSGNEEVQTEQDFRDFVKEEIEQALVAESNFRFKIDAKKKLLTKLNLSLPEEFLKRWLLYANKELTQEQLDRDFELFADDLRWTLIINKIMKENSLEIQDDDMLQQAKNEMLYQFRQYGLANVPNETLEKYAGEMLQREKDVKRIYEAVAEQKVLEFVKNSVKLEENLVSSEEFDKLFA